MTPIQQVDEYGVFQRCGEQNVGNRAQSGGDGIFDPGIQMNRPDEIRIRKIFCEVFYRLTDGLQAFSRQFSAMDGDKNDMASLTNGFMDGGRQFRLVF